MAFWKVPLTIFIVQFCPMVYGLACVLPAGCRQWATGGRNFKFPEGHKLAHFTNPLELEVIEWIDPADPGPVQSLRGKTRLNGTRFMYYNLWRQPVVTAAVVDKLCASQMMGILMQIHSCRSVDKLNDVRC